MYITGLLNPIMPVPANDKLAVYVVYQSVNGTSRRSNYEISFKSYSRASGPPSAVIYHTVQDPDFSIGDLLRDTIHLYIAGLDLKEVNTILFLKLPNHA